MKILVSACLVGDPVRYDGKAKPVGGIEALYQTHEVFKLCPEVAAGLPVPRDPAELNGTSIEILNKKVGGVFTKTGQSVTAEFLRGAQTTLAFCLDHGIEAAVLKERSPSCGLTQVYDGSHTGTIIPGTGLTAALLREAGIKVYSEDNFQELLVDYKKNIRSM